ncbi:hypothetical protein [Staphylococcus hominis]|uniref:hypothetical protein n=1 Tax=Staphylococcus hominis TaxID=1290 RepID=UPI003DA72E8C
MLMLMHYLMCLCLLISESERLVLADPLNDVLALEIDSILVLILTMLMHYVLVLVLSRSHLLMLMHYLMCLCFLSLKDSC